MTRDNLFQIIKVVVIISWGAEYFKRQVSNDWGGAVIEEQKLPLKAMSRSEFAAVWVH